MSLVRKEGGGGEGKGKGKKRRKRKRREREEKEMINYAIKELWPNINLYILNSVPKQFGISPVGL